MSVAPLLLWLLARMPELAGADGGLYGAYMSPDEIRDFCGHGTLNRTTGCQCSPGWRIAGPTDPINLLKGGCTQFQCQSNQQCQERLRISTASCPVKGWDCYCGWVFAFSGKDWNWLSSGYTTWGDESAACMGPLFALSIWVSGNTMWLMLHLWKLVLVAAIVMLPFGQTNTRCTCHDPGMFRLVAAITGRGSTCDGRRCMAEALNRWKFFYDCAWSLYVLDLALWVYCFLLTLWMTFLVSWLILIWLLVIMAAIVFLIMTVCMAQDSGGVGGGGAEGGCCCCCGEGEAASCHGGSFECGFFDVCCGQGYTANATGASLDPLSIFFAGGPYPVSSDADPCCGCCGLLSSNRKCCLCRPVLNLLLHFPRHPANMWGGFAGYLMGTHPRSMNVYAGGNRVVDFLGFRGRADLHGNEVWRQRVAAFLEVGNSGAGPHQAAAPVQNQMRQPEARAPRREDSPPRSFTSSQVDLINGRRIGLVSAPFDQTRDNCRESSFEDYAKGNCWICCNSKEAEQWDMWLQCGHMYCSRCSTEMLKRNMPCPLCRQVSWNVKRGPALYCAPAHVPAV